jgi:hypothetical protein
MKVARVKMDHPPADPADAEGAEIDGQADDPDQPDDGKASGKAKDGLYAATGPLRQIVADEDQSLKGTLDSLGADGSFRIGVYRLEPEEWQDPQTGRRVKTAGKLKTYTSKIDEDLISDRHGGGKYQLRFSRRDAKGSYKFFTQRTIDIAGDPRIDDVPRTAAPAGGQTVVTAPSESPGLVKEAFAVLRDQLDRASEPRESGPRRMDPAVEMMLDQMRRDAERRDNELAELRRDLAQSRAVKPVEDPVKDKLLSSLIDGERGHVTALQLRYEAEARQIKSAAEEDIKRLHDRHERDVANVRAGFEREIAAIRSSHEVALASQKASFDMQVKLLESDNRRLERDNTELRADVKELRARKDRTIVETAKELEAVKDALGLGDGDGDKSNFDKFLEVATSPAAAEFVSKVVGGGEKPAAQPAAQQPSHRPSRKLMQDPAGNKFIVTTDGAGQERLIPVKKKPRVIPATTNPDGTVATPAIELPQVDPVAVAAVVGYLERAFSNKQEPEVVAQSGRASVPDEILTWIRDHDSDRVSGVDLFMREVAKLPSTSPLSTQSGKNWLRKVGKALVGE